jgi:hypothetical protein
MVTRRNGKSVLANDLADWWMRKILLGNAASPPPGLALNDLVSEWRRKMMEWDAARVERGFAEVLGRGVRVLWPRLPAGHALYMTKGLAVVADRRQAEAP